MPRRSAWARQSLGAQDEPLDEVWGTKCGDEVSLTRWPNTSSPVFVAHFVVYASSIGFVGRSGLRGEISKPNGGTVNGYKNTGLPWRRQ